jgi:transposase-like protein
MDGMSTQDRNSSSIFRGRHFDPSIIILCVRWYITYKLSSRDNCEMMAERGIEVVHITILRWVQKYIPEFEKQWTTYAKPVGRSWRVNETYIKIRGAWKYLYRAVDKRAVDKEGLTVDFQLSEHRDIDAAKRFFTQAIAKQEAPIKITLDSYEASRQAVAELKRTGILPDNTLVRTSKYLNNIIEQDHRIINQRIRPMLGFKDFSKAVITISGIELVQKIKKGQFDLTALHQGEQIPVHQLWDAVLVA